MTKYVLTGLCPYCRCFSDDLQPHWAHFDKCIYLCPSCEKKINLAIKGKALYMGNTPIDLNDFIRDSILEQDRERRTWWLSIRDILNATRWIRKIAAKLRGGGNAKPKKDESSAK